MAESMWAPSNRSKPTAPPASSSSSPSTSIPSTKPPATPAVVRSNSGKHDIPPHQAVGSNSTPKTLGEEASARRALAALNGPPSGGTGRGGGGGGGGRGGHHNNHHAHGHGHGHDRSVSHPNGSNSGFHTTGRGGPPPGNGFVGAASGGSGGGRNRRQEKEELIKSIWGDSDEEDDKDNKKEEVKAKPTNDLKTNTNTEAGEETDEDDPHQPRLADVQDDLASRDQTDPAGTGQVKKKLGVEDSIWAPKNRGKASPAAASGSGSSGNGSIGRCAGAGGGSVTGSVGSSASAEKTKEEPIKVDDLSVKVDELQVTEVATKPVPNPPTTSTSTSTSTPATTAAPAPEPTTTAPEPVKPKTLEPIGRFRQTDPADASGINWADDDEEDEVGGFMEDVMAQWGMGGAKKGDDDEKEEEQQVAEDSGVEHGNEDEAQVVRQPELATVQEEKRDVVDESDKPKPAKVSLSDRIDWDRQAAPPAEPPRGPSAGPASWRSDPKPHYQQNNGIQGSVRGRGRGGHSRQQSYDHAGHNDRQARGGKRPTELLNLPESPVTPASTAIITPTPSTTSADEHPVRSGRKDEAGPPHKPFQGETAEARRARTERPKLALQDSTFKRMTRGLLGGPGGQGPARNNEGNKFGSRKQEGRQGPMSPATPVIPIAPVEPAIATPTGIPDDFGGNDDGWNEVKSKSRSGRGRKRNF